MTPSPGNSAGVRSGEPGDRPLALDFLDGPVELAAERLLGCRLERITPAGRAVVRIVETEAYGPEDAASHSFRGETLRNGAMFGPSGRLYVYLIYGIHFCANVVVGPPGHGAAVLIRTVEPVAGGELLESNRGVAGPNATNGPGKLCQALAIDRDLDRHDLREQPLRLLTGTIAPDETILVTPRIGITRETELRHRFLIAESRYVSRGAG